MPPSPRQSDRRTTAAEAPLQHTVDVLLYALVMLTVAAVVTVGARRSGYVFEWSRLGRYMPLLWRGLGLTVVLSAVSLPIAFVLGLATALARRSASPVARGLARVYLETVRNTPLLIQILFVFAVLRPVLGLPDLVAGVLALSVFEGAYASEMFRAGIDGVSRGQWEAAWSLGLSRSQTFVYIIFPQVMRRMLPALVGQAVSLVKDSSLLSVVSIAELTLRARQVYSDTFLSFEVWLTVAVMYLGLTLTLSTAARVLERRMQRRTAEGGSA